MNSGFKKTLTVTICAVIGLGLGACSDAALKDQKSVTSGRVSQNNETKALVSLFCDTRPLVTDFWSFNAASEHAPNPRPITAQIVTVKVFLKPLFMLAPLNLSFLPCFLS